MQKWQRASVVIATATLGIGLAFNTFTRAANAHGDEDHAGGKHEEAFAAGEPGDPKKPFRRIELTMSEGSGTMAFTPSTVDVKKGEQIKFVIKNTGALSHEFMLDSIEHNAKHKIAMEKNPEMVHDDPNGVTLEATKSSEIFWKFSKAGSFEFACLIPGHYEAGMHGLVVVK